MDDAYALIVGIADYPHVAGLPDAVRNDARDVRDLLVDPRHCGYPPGHVTLLLDGRPPARPSSTRCPGWPLTPVPVRRPHLHLKSRRAGGVRSLRRRVHLARRHRACLRRGSRRDRHLRRRVHRGPEDDPGSQGASHLRLLPRGRHRSAQDDAAGSLIKAGLPDGYYERLAAGRGRAILSSSRDTESSYVLPAAANSLFTRHLLAGLKGGVPSEDGLVRVFDLFEYVQPRVTSDQPNQHPVFKADLEENFPVGLYLGGKKDVATRDEEGFRYDAYLSYADRAPDSTWVWETLIPRLEREGLRLVVSGTSRDPGVPLVVNSERGIRQAKRTLVLLSRAYLEDNMADFENVAAQSVGIEEGAYRLLPVQDRADRRGEAPGETQDAGHA